MSSAITSKLRLDAHAWRERYRPDLPARKGLLRFVLHPSLRALWLFRCATEGPALLRHAARHRLLRTYACDVQSGADISGGLILPHPVGIVVGPGVRTGYGVVVRQNVTLGGGAGGYPTLEAGVEVYPNAVIAGRFTIGARARIGAQAVVTGEVPSGSTVPAAARWPE